MSISMHYMSIQCFFVNSKEQYTNTMNSTVEINQVTLGDIERIIEKVSEVSAENSPNTRRRADLLASFKYLQRINYGSMEAISQVLAYKYYYRPRSVYTIISKCPVEVANPKLKEKKLSAAELLAIRESVQIQPYWMNSRRRHQDVCAAFKQWKNLGEASFVCRLLGYIYYLRPNTVRLILKNSQ